MTFSRNGAGNPLLDISAVVDQALLDKYKVGECGVAILYVSMLVDWLSDK